MSSFGQRDVATIARGIQVSADGQPEMKANGVTVDWSTVAAVGADVTLIDETEILNGEKYLRYGQVLCEISTAEQQTVDLSPGSDPTGGTWEMTILGETILAIPYNVSAAVLQESIRSLNVAGASQVTVTKSGFVYTITFPGHLGNVAVITADGTGMDTATAITIATVTAGIAGGGKYGPYDDGASDGRQTLTPGKCFVLNRTVKEDDLKSDHPPVLFGGRVWKERLLATSGTHTLAAGPTYTELFAVLPRLQFQE